MLGRGLLVVLVVDEPGRDIDDYAFAEHDDRSHASRRPDGPKHTEVVHGAAASDGDPGLGQR